MSSSTLVTPQSTAAAPDIPRQRIRLEFIDGLRALMALWVVVGHISQELLASGARMDRWSEFMRHHALMLIKSGLYAHFPVVVFIVLSGYCLTVPLVGSEGLVLPDGLRQFFIRRARRILPPYYAALSLTIGSDIYLATLRHQPLVTGGGRLFGIPDGAYISSLLLIHNTREVWAMYFGPLWSIATEWQLYFVFPLLLLPIARRWGLPAAVAFAALAGRGLTTALLHLSPGNMVMPWFVAFFAMGMLTACRALPNSVHRSSPMPYVAVAIGFIAVIIISAGTSVAMDYAIAIAACALLAHYTHHVTRRGTLGEPAAHAWLENPRLVWIGGFSYSLYLIHAALLGPVHQLLASRLSASETVAVLLLVFLPLTIAVAYGFHRVFERPFMNLKPPAKPSEVPR